MPTISVLTLCDEPACPVVLYIWNGHNNCPNCHGTSGISYGPATKADHLTISVNKKD